MLPAPRALARDNGADHTLNYSTEDLKTADEARRALEEALLAQFAVTAPFDGLVTEVTATVGETAARSEALLVLEDLSTLEAVVFAPIWGVAYAATFVLDHDDPIFADWMYDEALSALLRRLR